MRDTSPEILYGFCEYTDDCDAPDHTEECPTYPSRECDEHDGGVGPCDEEKYHGVVHDLEVRFPEATFWGDVVETRCTIERDEGGTEYGKSYDIRRSAIARGTDDEEYEGYDSENKPEKVGEEGEWFMVMAKHVPSIPF